MNKVILVSLACLLPIVMVAAYKELHVACGGKKVCKLPASGMPQGS